MEYSCWTTLPSLNLLFSFSSSIQLFFTCVFFISAGAIVEYKYVLLDSSGRGVREWQAGANNVLAVKLSEERLELIDTW